MAIKLISTSSYRTDTILEIYNPTVDTPTILTIDNGINVNWLSTGYPILNNTTGNSLILNFNATWNIGGTVIPTNNLSTNVLATSSSAYFTDDLLINVSLKLANAGDYSSIDLKIIDTTNTIIYSSFISIQLTNTNSATSVASFNTKDY